MLTETVVGYKMTVCKAQSLMKISVHMNYSVVPTKLTEHGEAF